MQKNYVAKTTVNFPDFQLYVRMGDVLVYDAAHDNTLTIYRGGSIVRTIKATPMSIAAMVKTKLLAEVVTPAPRPAVAVSPITPPVPKNVVKPKPQPKKETPKIKTSEESVTKISTVDAGTPVYKSKSEAKRIAHLKGEDPVAAAASVPARPIIPEENSE